MIHPILPLMPLVNCQKVGYNGVTNSKGADIMTDYKAEFMKVIDESDDPVGMATFILSLFCDYLRTASPSQESCAAVPQESDR